MKKILKDFLDNLKMVGSSISIILGCGFLIFLLFEALKFVVTMITSPVVSFMAYMLFLIIVSSVLLTLFDMSSNKSD